MSMSTAPNPSSSLYGAATNMAPTLPREVLKWLQTLKLSHPVRLPRRDLMTGFTVAEICGIYWADVPMHSFTNQLSAANKESNWHLLRRIFLANGLVFKNPKSISPFQHTSEAQMAAVRKNMSAEEAAFDALLTGVMNGEGNSAFELIHLLYTAFTGKVVPPTGALAPPVDLPPSLPKPPPFTKNTTTSGGAGGGANPTSLFQQNEAARAAAQEQAVSLQARNQQAEEERRRRAELLGEDLLNGGSSPTTDNNNNNNKRSGNAAASSPSAQGRTVAKLVRKQAEAIRAAPTADADDEGPSVQFSNVTIRPLPSHLLARFGGGGAMSAAGNGGGGVNNANNGNGKNGSGNGANGGAKDSAASAAAAAAGGDICGFLSNCIDTILTQDIQVDPFSVALGAAQWSLDSTVSPTLFDYVLNHSSLQQQATVGGGGGNNAVNTAATAVPATTTLVGLVWEGLALSPRLNTIAAHLLANPLQMKGLLRAMLRVKPSAKYTVSSSSSAAAASDDGLVPSVTTDVPSLQNADVVLNLIGDGCCGAAGVRNPNLRQSPADPLVMGAAITTVPMTAAERLAIMNDFLTLLYGVIGDHQTSSTSTSASSADKKKNNGHKAVGGAGSKAANSGLLAGAVQHHLQHQQPSPAQSRKDLIRLLLQHIPHHTFLALIVAEMMSVGPTKTLAMLRSFVLPSAVEGVVMMIGGSAASSGGHHNYHHHSAGGGGAAAASLTNNALMAGVTDLSTGGRRNGLFYVAPSSSSTDNGVSGSGNNGKKSQNGNNRATNSAGNTSGSSNAATATAANLSVGPLSDPYSTESIAAALRTVSYGKLSIISWICSLFSFSGDACDTTVTIPGVNFPIVTSNTPYNNAAGAFLAPIVVPSTGGPIEEDGIAMLKEKEKPLSLEAHQPTLVAFRKLQAAHRLRVHEDAEGQSARDAGALRVISIMAALKEVVGREEAASPAYLTSTCQLLELLVLKARAGDVIGPLSRALVAAGTARRGLLLEAHAARKWQQQQAQLMMGGGGGRAGGGVQFRAGGGGGAVVAPPVVSALKRGGGGGGGGGGVAFAANDIAVAPYQPNGGGGGGNAANANSAHTPGSVANVVGKGGLYCVASTLLYCRPVQSAILQVLLDDATSILKERDGGSGHGASGCGLSGGGGRSSGGSVAAALGQLRLLLVYGPMSLLSAAALAVPSQLAEMLAMLQEGEGGSGNNNNNGTGTVSSFGGGGGAFNATSFSDRSSNHNNAVTAVGGGGTSQFLNKFRSAAIGLGCGPFIAAYAVAKEATALVESVVLESLLKNAFTGASYVGAGSLGSVPEWIAAVDVFSAAVGSLATIGCGIAQGVFPLVPLGKGVTKRGSVSSPAMAMGGGGTSSNELMSLAPFFASPRSRVVLGGVFSHLASPNFLTIGGSSAAAGNGSSSPPSTTSSSSSVAVAPVPVQAFAAFALSRLLPIASISLGLLKKSNHNANGNDKDASADNNDEGDGDDGLLTAEDAAESLFNTLDAFDRRALSIASASAATPQSQSHASVPLPRVLSAVYRGCALRPLFFIGSGGSAPSPSPLSSVVASAGAPFSPFFPASGYGVASLCTGFGDASTSAAAAAAGNNSNGVDVSSAFFLPSSMISCGPSLLADLLMPVGPLASTVRGNNNGVGGAGGGGGGPYPPPQYRSNITANNNSSNGQQQMPLLGGPRDAAVVALADNSLVNALAPLLYLCECVGRKAAAMAQKDAIVNANDAAAVPSPSAATAVVGSRAGSATVGRRASLSAAAAAAAAAVSSSSTPAAAAALPVPVGGAAATAPTATPFSYGTGQVPAPPSLVYIITAVDGLLGGLGAATASHRAATAAAAAATTEKAVSSAAAAAAESALAGDASAAATSPTATAASNASNASSGIVSLLAMTTAATRLVSKSPITGGTSGNPFTGLFTPAAGALELLLAATAGANTKSAAASAAAKKSFTANNSNTAHALSRGVSSSSSSSPFTERWWSFMKAVLGPAVRFFLEAEAVHSQQLQANGNISTTAPNAAHGVVGVGVGVGGVSGGDAAAAPLLHGNAPHHRTAEIRLYSALSRAIVVRLYQGLSGMYVSHVLSGSEEATVEAIVGAANSGSGADGGGTSSSLPAAGDDVRVRALRWWAMAVV